MPSANDAVLTDLYTASTGLDVLDDHPNTPAPGGTGPAATFDLQLEAVAGNVLGGGGADYTLTITCIDETLGAPNHDMSSSFNQDFSVLNGWNPGGAAGNFAKKQTVSVTVPAGVRGHLFHFLATLVSKDSNVVSYLESNRFILV